MTTVAEMRDRIERRTRIVAADEMKPALPEYGRGVVASVVGNQASIRKGTAETEPTGGFTVPADINVAADDLVFYFESGIERQIIHVIARAVPLIGASLSDYPKLVKSGTVGTAALTAPGVATVGVKVETGLTYVPMVLVYHSSGDGVWRQAPNLLSNTAGQILENYRYSVTVADTNKTRFVFATYSSRPEGVAAQTYRWLIFDRQIS